MILNLFVIVKKINYFILRLFFVFLFIVLAGFLKSNKVFASTLFEDNFDRPDQETLGSSWQEFFGSLPSGVANNKAYIRTGSGGLWGNYFVQNINIANQDVTVTFTHQDGDSAVFARTINNSNTIYVDYYKNNSLQVFDIYNGVYTFFPNDAPNAIVGNTYTIEIITVGYNLKVFVNGIQYVDALLSHTTSGSAGFGASDGYTDVFFDDFSIKSYELAHKPKLTINTVINNNYGGTLNNSDVTPKVGETEVTSGIENEFDVGEYTISTNNISGYTKTFSDGCDSTGKIILNDDDVKTCTITLSDIQPNLLVIKHVNGGIKNANEFNLNISGTKVSSDSIQGSESGINVSLDQGPYKVIENDYPDYSKSLSEECGGNINVGENKTCTVTNTYVPPLPTPVPVTKIVVTPGLGASWNLTDFITCANSGSSDGWSLAPYAKDVYQDLLDSLSAKGWKVEPFYYDWRRNIVNNVPTFTNFVNSITENNEKIDFVGHSMGGLIGRAYMEANSGGKFAKYLSVGTPHQGSAMSYAPWEGGEIWNTNLVEEIALDLYLKHCGSLFTTNKTAIQTQFPSIQNLLPTEPYLKNIRTGLKTISSMQIKNNYLPTNFVSNFWGVKTGAISGTGHKTLKIIDVISPTYEYLRVGNWVDGVPIDKEYTNQGDGTVLTSSSQLPGGTNITINQTHRGLVASTEGINAILGFFGKPGIDDPPYSNTSSALIIVAYPGTFIIKDSNNNTWNSDNGMVAIMNPKDGSYELSVSSPSANTNIIIDQFLSNGQTFYKSYKFDSTKNPTKIVTYNSRKINANPMEDIKDYKNPPFPKFWNGFWKWWKYYWKNN